MRAGWSPNRSKMDSVRRCTALAANCRPLACPLPDRLRLRDCTPLNPPPLRAPESCRVSDTLCLQAFDGGTGRHFDCRGNFPRDHRSTFSSPGSFPARICFPYSGTRSSVTLRLTIPNLSRLIPARCSCVGADHASCQTFHGGALTMNLFHHKCAKIEDSAFSRVLRSLPRYTAPESLKKQVTSLCLDRHRMARKEVGEKQRHGTKWR